MAGGGCGLDCRICMRAVDRRRDMNIILLILFWAVGVVMGLIVGKLLLKQEA